MKKNELFQEVKELIGDFTRSKSLSRSKLSEMLGVSAATLSAIDNDHHDKVNESMLIKIRSTIRPQKWKIVSTANLNTVVGVCEHARVSNQMAGIIGYTGAGKTVALNHYYRTNPNTFMVTCKKSMRPKQFFEKLLRNIGVSFSGTLYDMVERISLEINSMEKPLIIIDEAGKLSQNEMLYLHDLWDNIEANAGMILAGVDYFKTNLLTAVQRQKEGMPEFNGRITFWQELNKPTKQEIKAICDANGVFEEEKIKTAYKAADYRFLTQMIKEFRR